MGDLRLQRIFIAATIILFLLLLASICLAIFLPDTGNEAGGSASGVISSEEARGLFAVEEVDFGALLSSPEDMMQTALSLACSWLEEDLEISEYSLGADGQRFYILSSVGGGVMGWIAIDAYGNLLTLQDPTLNPPYPTDVNLEKEQAEAVAVGLLERLGFEAGSLEIMNSELRSTPALEYVIAVQALPERHLRR